MPQDEARLEWQGVEFATLGGARPPTATPPPSRGLRALVEAVLPAEAARDPARVARVAEFVQAQIEALPRGLRGLLAFGLAGFHALVALRYARGFVALDAERRRNVVRAWSYGPLPPSRALFRVLRSPALLAWYDLPAEPRS